jgi:hypothetical protein
MSQDILDRLPKAASTKSKVATFRDWLLAEAADDARWLRKVFAG